MAARVQVVGGGVIGLACAWELSRNGHEVTVVAPAPGRDGASWVAAGMLAPVTEAHFGESALTRLLVEGARRWPAFAAALEGATGQAIGYDTTGTVTVALDASDLASLDDLLAYQHTLGLEAHRRSASECRALVPALSPALRGGIEVPGDHQVDNRALLGALAEACRRGGVTFVEGTVAALAAGPELVLADGRRLCPDHVVLAAGTGLRAIDGLAGAGLPSIRPVKGHILRLGPADGVITPPRRRTVRGLVHGRSVYLVPRRDGSVVVGATVEERGSDTAVGPARCTSCWTTRGRSSRASTSSSWPRRPPGCAPPPRTTCRASGGRHSTACWRPSATTATACSWRRSPRPPSSTSWGADRWPP